MANENDAAWIIDTMPTKELFIDMLTRDIALCPAIIDLVDNCADGAKRLQGEGSFKNLWARVEISSEEFRISDNCGGIPVDVARKYAFRFGRPPGAPSVKHSVGQFGVGMKRAIFKMGKKFRVESATATSRFVVEVDVDKWASERKWEFEFSELKEDIRVPREEQGTTIQVEDLHYHQLFNFQYADNAKMLTVGGLVTNSSDSQKLNENHFRDLDFIRTEEADGAYRIESPILTLREIRFLDERLPRMSRSARHPRWLPEDERKKYAKVYRYFPAFSEVEA